MKGIGCESCVLPSKERILRIKGVHSVRVYGSRVEVEYDEGEVSLSEILRALEPFYSVSVEGEAAKG